MLRLASLRTKTEHGALGDQRSGFWVSIRVLHWTKNIVNFSSRTHTFKFYRGQFSRIVVDCCQNRLYVIAHSVMGCIKETVEVKVASEHNDILISPMR